jgi:hypothetical protein
MSWRPERITDELDAQLFEHWTKRNFHMLKQILAKHKIYVGGCSSCILTSEMIVAFMKDRYGAHSKL